MSAVNPARMAHFNSADYILVKDFNNCREPSRPIRSMKRAMEESLNSRSSMLRKPNQSYAVLSEMAEHNLRREAMT